MCVCTAVGRSSQDTGGVQFASETGKNVVDLIVTDMVTG